MRPTLSTLFLAILASRAFATAPPASADALETMFTDADNASRDEMKAKDRTGKPAVDAAWDNLLRETRRAIGLRGKAGEGYDRSRLYELCGDVQLRTNQFTPAAESFNNAAEVPSATDYRVDRCTAMARLMPRTDARGYQSPVRRGAGVGDVIVLTTPESEKRAANLYLTAELQEIDQNLEKTLDARAIKVAAAGVQANAELRAVERFARGTTDACDAQRQRLIDRVIAAFETFTESANTSLNALEFPEVAAAASQPSDGPATRPTKSIKSILDDCQSMSKDYARLRTALGGEPPPALVAQTQQVERVYTRANRLRIGKLLPGEASP